MSFFCDKFLNTKKKNTKTSHANWIKFPILHLYKTLSCKIKVDAFFFV